ncbi:CU044_2847 family protein [Nocardia fluminea]|uniref:CU044_2847 family protein n=1 Tax=Nocardia fluminea TaxID=134984 RepID=UPI00366A26E4
MPLVSFPVEGGGEVLIQVEPDGEIVTRGGRDHAAQAVEEAKRSFDSALSTIHVVAQGVLDQICGLVTPPAEVRVQFGLEFNAKAGAVIASAGATAQLRAEMTWHLHGRNQDDSGRRTETVLNGEPVGDSANTK